MSNNTIPHLFLLGCVALSLVACGSASLDIDLDDTVPTTEVGGGDESSESSLDE